MKTKLALQEFIAKNADWEQKLQEKPYYITISRDNLFGKRLVMFKYSQIDSDFYNPIVRECRGIVLDENTFEVVCYPFQKFGNYGEGYVPKIDWKTSFVSQKLDGSLIKVVKLGSGLDAELLVSTNGTIDAYKAPLPEQIGCKAQNFGDLFEEALLNAQQELKNKACCDIMLSPKQWLAQMLEENKTYMFELTSPFNKVVVAWHETRLNFIGMRDNLSYDEQKFFEQDLAKVFNTPKLFFLKSLDECVAAANELGPDQEGFVICDAQWNRCKVKSILYCSLAHMRNNGVLSYERGLEIVRGNELGEVLTYFPEFKPHLEKIRERYEEYIASLEDAHKQLQDWLKQNGYDRQPWWVEAGGQKRKDAAIFIQKIFKIPGVGFALLDKKVNSVKEYALQVPAKNLIKALGFKCDEA